MKRLKRIGGHVWRWAMVGGVAYCGVEASMTLWPTSPQLAVVTGAAFGWFFCTSFEEAILAHLPQEKAA